MTKKAQQCRPVRQTPPNRRKDVTVKTHKRSSPKPIQGKC